MVAGLCPGLEDLRMTHPSFRQSFPVWILITACFLIYGRTLTGDFLPWDDLQHIALNKNLIAGNVKYFWQNAYYGMFVPVTYSVWSLLNMLSPEPWTYHLLNLVLHSANGLLVYALLKRVTLRSTAPALWGALFFMVYPLQVEAVAWISEGRGQLAAFFGLSAAALLKTGSTKAFHISATILFALAVLSKPSITPLPLALLALNWGAREKIFPPRVLAAWALISVIALKWTLALQTSSADPRLVTTWPERLLITLDTLGFYARAVFLPWPLSFSYDRQIENVINQQLYLKTIPYLLLAMIVVFFLARRLGRPIIGGALVALIFLIPVSGIVPFAGQVQSTTFDRYMYLPMFGLTIIITLICHSQRSRIFVALILTGAAGLSFVRAGDWLSNRALTESALTIDPQNYFALNNLGIQEIAEKNYVAAEARLRSAWNARPKEALAPANLAHVLWLRNDVGSVLKEIKPLTQTKTFLNYNQREVEALALTHRMVARALNTILDREGAAQAYATALKYEPSNEELRAEVELFKNEARR